MNYALIRSGRLRDVMEFDHVVRVTADGNVFDAEPGVPYAPELYHDETNDYDVGPWSLMTGYTGQYGYRGPIMHASEFIGGGMARDIRATPGLYVAVVCNVDSCEDCVTEDGDEIPDPECRGEHEPAGWAVAYIAD